MRASFSVNLHDSDGDIYQECLLIHLEDKVILPMKNKKDLEELIKHLNQIKKELDENYEGRV
jgi:hypothetical protein